MFCLFLGTLVVLGEESSSLEMYVNYMDSSVQIRALETMVDLGDTPTEQLITGWSSSEIHTRERLADSLYRTSHAEGLNLGWSEKITDQERCRLALRLSTMGYAEDMIVAAPHQSIMAFHGLCFPTVH